MLHSNRDARRGAARDVAPGVTIVVRVLVAGVVGAEVVGAGVPAELVAAEPRDAGSAEIVALTWEVKSNWPGSPCSPNM